ncbi:MAG: hypothetical protein GYB68_04575 [Chloroflexi bacterium]|nr:hypothetical protein [Chloroflexota bacterium]
MTHFQVAFTTFHDEPQLNKADELGAEALAAFGVQVSAVVWDEADVDWSAYDAVVLRACWDYHRKRPQFMAWLEQVDQDTQLINPLETVLGNMHKTYLREMEQQGAQILPTVWLEAGQELDLAALLEEQAWDQVVIKPTVSLSAENTWRSSPSQAAEHQARFADLLATRDMMVQQFAPHIMDEGEYSLLFFNGEKAVYSHTSLKRPASGDFTIQSGTWSGVPTDADMLATAWEIINLIEGDWVYARVDGVRHQGQFALMELELIEPYLYLEDHPDAAQQFARALRSRL